MSILEDINSALQRGKAKDVKALVQQALDEGIAPVTILNEGLLSAMDVIGVKFKANEIYVPEVLIAARAMNGGMDILKPILVAAGNETIGKVVIGTVKGDLHDIGKNLVKMMIEGKGIEVIDLGVDVTPEAYVQACKDNDAHIICCSALLTTTMNEMKAVVDLVKTEGLDITVMVGGAPVTDNFKTSIGANFYAPDAASAADCAKEVCLAK